MEEKKQFPDRPEPSRRNHHGFRNKHFFRTSDSSKLTRHQSHHISRQHPDRETDRHSNPLASFGLTSTSPSSASASSNPHAKQHSDQPLPPQRHNAGDSSRLSRRNSHYESSSAYDNSARLSRKSSRRQIIFDDQHTPDRHHNQISESPLPTITTTTTPPSPPVSPSANFHGQTGRTQRLTDKERKERKRRQNTESARRTREKRRVEMERLEMVYDANEMKIKELELMADQLSRELRRHNTISGVGRTGSSQLNEKDERPKWFGVPF